MADLISSIENGQIIKNTTNNNVSNKPGGELGKDAFLQLLVCQMQNQDPLNPADNSEYIAQLTTFSQLESLQNIESAITNSQAVNMTGKFVDVVTTSSNGKTEVISGYVDYVCVQDGKTYVCIEGKSYLAENVSTVYDTEFLKDILDKVEPEKPEESTKPDESKELDKPIEKDEDK